MIWGFEKHRIVSFIITILIAIQIYYLSSIPGQVGGIGNIWISRAYHLAIFFLLTFFLLTTIKGIKNIKLRHILIVLTITIFYAIFDEIHQTFVPYRHCSIIDVLTDSAGILTAILLYKFLEIKQHEHVISA